MVIKFEDYKKLNEEKLNRSDVLNTIAALLTVVSADSEKIGSHMKPYTKEYIEQYAKNVNIANDNPLVQQAIKDFKSKIQNDPKILNKQELINKVDNVSIIYKKNDELTYQLRQASSKNRNLDASSFIVQFKDNQNIIFLDRNADYYEIMHELSHLVENSIQTQNTILTLFNFNQPYNKQQAIFFMLTGGEYSMKKPIEKKYIDYLKESGEIYVRLNNLKFFLYKYGYLTTPNQEVDKKIMIELYSGYIFKKLNDEDKQKFLNSDFMQILPFLDVNRFPEINQYVMNNIKNNQNLT